MIAQTAATMTKGPGNGYFDRCHKEYAPETKTKLSRWDVVANCHQRATRALPLGILITAVACYWPAVL
jgi:hypothetical protein